MSCPVSPVRVSGRDCFVSLKPYACARGVFLFTATLLDKCRAPLPSIGIPTPPVAADFEHRRSGEHRQAKSAQAWSKHVRGTGSGRARRERRTRAT
eukprot:574611-Prymnesium_polylepis.2